MVSIIIGIAYEIRVFGDVNNIEVAYQVAYQKIIKDRNYLKLLEGETIN